MPKTKEQKRKEAEERKTTGKHIQETSVPDYFVKRRQAHIDALYARLCARAARKEINRSCIYGVLIPFCKQAEHSTGINWKWFMPEEFQPKP